MGGVIGIAPTCSEKFYTPSNLHPSDPDYTTLSTHTHVQQHSEKHTLSLCVDIHLFKVLIQHIKELNSLSSAMSSTQGICVFEGYTLWIVCLQR